MEAWQMIGGFVLSAFIGGFIRDKFFNEPQRLNAKDGALAAKVAALESEVAVIQATKLTEGQVRSIVHEQIQPMMVSINEILKDQKKQGDLLNRIDERLSSQDRK